MLLSTYKNTENGHIFNIYSDDDAFNPIEELENICFIAAHRHYNLGNFSYKNLSDIFTIDEWFKLSEKKRDALTFEEWRGIGEFLKEAQEVLQEEKNLIVLPVFMYEHSNIAFSLSSFNDPFDSGQVGFIVAKRSDVAAMYLKKYCTKEVTKKFEKYLFALLNEYENYCNGNCFYIQEFDNEENEIDSCGGFLADYDEEALCHFLGLENLPKTFIEQ